MITVIHILYITQNVCVCAYVYISPNNDEQNQRALIIGHGKEKNNFTNS